MESRHSRTTAPKQFLVAAFLLAGLVAAIWTPWKAPAVEKARPQATQPAVVATSGAPTAGFDLQACANQLVRAGWGEDAAKAVVDLNADWFAIQREENPAGFALQMKLLEGLSFHGRDAFLMEHPETAGLLASADDPETMANGLKSANEDYHRICGLYVQHCTPWAARGLALAIRDNSDMILELQLGGFVGSEVLFIFDRPPDDEAAKSYDLWLKETLASKLRTSSNDEIASFVNLAIRHGPGIRERMRKDELFRHDLGAVLWPWLVNVVKDGMYEEYLEDPRIWDILGRKDGELLLERSGMLAIDLLYGHSALGPKHAAYPKPLHETVVQILLRQEASAIHALMRYRNEPLFLELLGRKLTRETLSACLGQLYQADPNHPELLARYAKLTDAALAEEVGPPASGIVTWVPFYYTVYEVPKKLLQGREPSAMDWLQAIADPAFLVVDIATGGGGKVVRETVSKGGRVAASAAAKNGEKVVVTTLASSGYLAKRQLTKRLGQDALARMGEKELANWTATATLSQMRQTLKPVLGKGSGAASFEITKPLQFMFQYSGVGRETWKRLTGLEARIFMRSDAKVFVWLKVGGLGEKLLGVKAARFLDRTAQDLAIGVAVESEPGQQVLREAWRRNVSAWWLWNSSHDPAQDKIGGQP